MNDKIQQHHLSISYFKSNNNQLGTMIPLLFLGADVFFGDAYRGWWWNEQRVPLYLYAGG